MSDPTPHTTYDDIPYPSHAFPQTHPDRLAVLATLFGMKPAAANRCRVLELGCASGGNLIPLALAYPDSTFLGIDLSARQIGDGQKTIEALRLKNVELRAMSILDVDDSVGRFDYVLCHGVYSWVPAPVQGKILDICAQNLQPDGVGYVSYNTFPGWHMRGMIRDMMCIHISRHGGDPATRVKQARGLLDFLARSVMQENNPYGIYLRQELELLQKHSDAYLFHEHLETCNDPIYFYEFHEALTAKRLRYLGEADFSVMVPANFPPDVQQVLNQVAPNQIEMEQYLDFLRNRTFRQTLICGEHIKPSYALSPEQMRAFQIAAPLTPHSTQPDVRSTAGEQFDGPNNANIQTSDPIIKAALVCLAERWPRPIPFDELRRLARARLNSVPPDDSAVVAQDALALGKAVLALFAGAVPGMIELWQHPPDFTATVSDRPVASGLARHQAASSLQVTCLRHQTVTLTEFDRQLLPFLDGTRHREQLLYQLVKRFQRGELHMTEDGRSVTEEARGRDLLARTLDAQLPKLARAGLLVG